MELKKAKPTRGMDIAITYICQCHMIFPVCMCTKYRVKLNRKELAGICYD